MIKNEATVKVTGWLNDPKSFDWGSAAKVSVDVRKKTETGTWETVDKVIYDVTFDSSFPDSKQVTVEGRITGVNTYSKRDGSTGVSIKVRADKVTPAIDKADAPF
jgi:hypothetical protein